MERLTTPRDIYFGRGGISAIESLRGTRAVLFTGGDAIMKQSFYARTLGHITKTGMELMVLSGIGADFNMRTAVESAKSVSAFEPEWIIALGGSSVIDAAKIVWLMYEYPEIRFRELINPLEIGELRRRARLLAIPTTSGQGSEVSAIAMLADAKTGIRYHVTSRAIVPDIAILDPDTADTMPKQAAISAGLGALCRAIEGYASAGGFLLSDSLALSAAAGLAANLSAAIAGDAQSRENVHFAQCMAGIAASNAGCGLAQAIANKLAGSFSPLKLPHGKLCAMLLPYVMRYNIVDMHANQRTNQRTNSRGTCLMRYARLARELALEGDDEAALAYALIDRVEGFLDEFAAPKTLKNMGLERAALDERLEELSKLICEDAAALTNPRAAKSEEVERLIVCAYEGGDVFF